MPHKIKGKTQKSKNPQIINASNINPRQLNINTLLKKHMSGYDGKTNITNANSDIIVINNILNNNNNTLSDPNNNPLIDPDTQFNNNKYNIVKYLGEGIQGSLYLANDSKKKRYICKKINLETNNSDQIDQIQFEINILKYLSRNSVTKDHVNPCLEHKIIDNNMFTIFPVFDGYSLNHLIKYVSALDNNSYYIIVFHLIKTILLGLAKIHQSKIAHQNINDNSILVSTYTNPSEMNVKFTDFALGCGNNMMDMDSKSNLININEYDEYDTHDESNKSPKSLFNFNSCKVNNFTPVTIDESVISELIDSDYLAISQKYDLLCLGAMFIKLLLFFDNINIDLTKGYNKQFIDNILQLLNDKYLSKINPNENEQKKSDYDKLFPSINVNSEVKRTIIEYLKIFKKYILCKTAHRKNCQYVLDKLIIYEKYKNDEF